MAEQRQCGQGRSEGERAIDERLLDEGRESQAEVLGAAQEGFERDQRSPDHPTRIKRASGVEDPSHSRGSTRQGPGALDLGQD